MVLLQSGSVLISMTYIYTKGHKDAQDLGHHLGLLVSEGHPTAGDKPISVACVVTQGYGDVEAKARAEFHVSVYGPWSYLGSELVSMVPVTIKGLADAWSMVSHLRPCCCLRALLPSRPY